MSSTPKSDRTALVLSGGGARGAYQAGVLKGLAEILESKKIENPFPILSGVSAGAINIAKIASSPYNFSTTTEKLVYFWSQIESSQVFKMNLMKLNSFASLLGKGFSYNSILDTEPLSAFLKENVDFDQIAKNIESEKHESVIITANNYLEKCAVSFIQSSERISKKHMSWKDSRRLSVETDIELQHIMASSAIPLLFPPIKIDGNDYGDGCVRNATPCSPSIRMGAKKLFVIGVRQQQSIEKSTNESILKRKKNSEASVTMLNIVNTLLNAVMLDSVEQDVHRIQRINELIDKANANSKTKDKKAKLKKIPALCISPSENIGDLARQSAHHLPRLLRTTLSSFGTLDDANEIMSYLMFNPHFCKKLIDMGYHDAIASKKEIISFFEEEVD